jgi:hypothetical protein
VAWILVVYRPCFTLWQGDSLWTHLRGKGSVLTVRTSTSHGSRTIPFYGRLLQPFSQQMSELDALYGEIRTTASHLSISE